MKIGKFVLLVYFLTISGSDSENQAETTTPKNDEKHTEKPLLVVKSVDKEKLPKETQMAQCTVTSGDIKASAQATFSKKLEGICSTKDMIDLRETLAALEDRLHYELYNLKLMIQNLVPNSFHQQPRFDNHQSYYSPNQGFSVPSFQPQNYRNIPPPVYRENTATKQTFNEVKTEKPKNVTIARKLTTTEETTTATTTTKAPEVFNVRKINLKSLDTGKRRFEATATPEPVTPATTEEPPKNEYTYYWKIEKFPRVFHHAKKNEIFSHVFNVKGLFLRMRAHLNNFDSDNLFFDIEHLANVENSEKLEIEISDGLVFKEIAEEKLFQYSFAIMDQNRPNHDLISQVYWNTDNENFLIPNSVHLLANYVKNESLLIKLLITF